jgi:D-serine deaminase-like pyridoxal phosphate-dependent protein
VISFAWQDVQSPTLVVLPEVAKTNINRMVDKAARHKVLLRPHFKTHQSADIAKWFEAAGVRAATVSSLTMAHYFFEAGWHDLTIAFPCNPRELLGIFSLERQMTLGVIVENLEVVNLLGTGNCPLKVWIKTDTGYGRTGVLWHDAKSLESIASRVTAFPALDFQGLLAHAGHAYGARTRADINAVHQQTLSRLQTAKAALERAGFTTRLSLGDTPCCSVAEDFSEVDELRPGNFVFYDLQQLANNVCQEQDLALALACPVVAKHSERELVVVYGGAVHFSKVSFVLTRA